MALVVAMAACEGAPTSELPPLEQAEMALDGFAVTLSPDTVGIWEGRSSDGTLLVRVGLTEWQVVGDLDRDGTPDALAVLWTSGGGSGTFMELASFQLDSTAGAGGVRWLRSGAVSLSDRVRIRAMTESSGTVELHVTRHGLDDPMCCPTVDTVLSFEVVDGRVAES